MKNKRIKLKICKILVQQNIFWKKSKKIICMKYFAGNSTFLLWRHYRINVLKNLLDSIKWCDSPQFAWNLAEMFLVITLISPEKLKTISFSEEEICCLSFLAKMYWKYRKIRNHTQQKSSNFPWWGPNNLKIYQ